MSSIWGKNLKISIFGESHGNNIGVVVDNFMAGVYFDTKYIYSQLKRRIPGNNFTSTARKESDEFTVLSGIFNNYTTGAPICISFKNNDTKSNDYSNLTNTPRPSHADYTATVKYNGYNDYRGGGHFSGRLTAPLVFAGALCQLYLEKQGITIGSHIYSIKDIEDDKFDMVNLKPDFLKTIKNKEFNVINNTILNNMLDEIKIAKDDFNSVGGIIECAVIGLNKPIGSPIFDSVESKIASILFSIPAVKGVEFGKGFDITKSFGDIANDLFCLDEEGNVKTKTNNNGGINGGIANGMPIIIKTAIKPTPSISKAQSTLNLNTKKIDELVIHGRHDPCIVTRCGVVVESAIAVAILDLLMENNNG